MKASVLPINQIKLNPDNPRVIKDDKFKKLVKSIQDFPEMLKVRPIVCNSKMVVLGGNMRLRACQEAGLKKVTVLIVEWSKEKQEEFIIKDNVGFGEWDWDKLANEWDALSLEDWGLDVPVVTSLEEIPGQDEAPGLQEEAISRPGDIWILGNHRVMCGDSTNPEHMERLLSGSRPDLVFTDPPYGVSIGDKNKVLNTVQPSGRCLRNIDNDTKSPEDLKKILLDVFTLARSVAADHCGFYVCSPQGGGLCMMMMMMMMQESGLEVRHILNWVKNNATFSIGRLDYDYQHEPIMFTWKKTHKKRMKGEHRTSCWFIDKPTESKLHPTMKPVAIPENAILNSSDKGDIILDMFGGAGSTLIACEKTGRAARLMEIDPLYVDVIVRRWQETFSAEAKLESDGQTFSQHETERKR